MSKSPKHSESKFRLDDRKYFFGQLLFNLGGVIFIAFVMSAIVFLMFGKGTGTLPESRSFIFLVVLGFTVIQCWAAVTNTRQDYLRGKWYMKSEPRAGAEAGYIPNPWRLVLPRALGVGLALGGLAAYLVPRLGSEPFHPVNLGFMAAIPLFAASAILIIFTLPRDQEAFASVFVRGQLPAVPLRRYLLLEHILPWVPLQGAINLGIGLKQFGNESEKLGGDVPILTVAFDAGFVFALIVLLSWLSSQIQVRPDVRLGRVPEDARKAPSVPVMLLICAAGFGAGAAAWVALYILFGPEIAPLPAACFKAVVVMAAVVPGCLLGVWWGRRRETALLNQQGEPTD